MNFYVPRPLKTQKLLEGNHKTLSEWITAIN